MKNIYEIYSKIYNNREKKNRITFMKYLNEFRAHIAFCLQKFSQ